MPAFRITMGRALRPSLAVLVATGVGAAPMVPALAADVEGWEVLQLSYRAAGQAGDPADALWTREIAEATRQSARTPNPGLPVATMRFADGSRTVVVSLALQPGPACDMGPNDAHSTRDYAVCPGKVAVMEGGQILASQVAGPLCAEAINSGGATRGTPGWQDPSRWGTRGRYDPVRRRVELMTLQNGRPERACNATIRLR